MSPLAITTLSFLLLLVIRVPVAFALAGASLVGIYISPLSMPFSILPTAMWQGVNSFLLLAIPFFILMGNLALVSGVTQRLVDATMAWIGHIRGGLAHVSVIVNMIMAGMSGSDLADAAATGSTLIPAMRKNGYPAGYAASIIAGAATIGPLVPPSIAFIIFAAATDTSVSRLFLGGAIPGVLLGLFLMAQAYVAARRADYRPGLRIPYRQRFRDTAIGFPVLLIPVAVLGSILVGIATPTEAAVIGVIAVILIGGLLYRELTVTQFGRQLIETLKLSASIFFIIATASAFARVLTLFGAAAVISDAVIGLTDDPTLFLLAAIALYLLLGCLIDTVPILLVVVPLLMPTVETLGIETVHFGVVTVFALLIGLITPPYGLTMFLVCQIAGIGLNDFWRHCWPIFLVLMLTLLLTALFAPLTTWLPDMLLPLR
jgi:C4-dicarboxylate transporter DctM subunit